MKRHLVAVSALVLSAAPSQAAYVLTVSQVGADVVTTGSGSLDLSGLSVFANASASSFFNPYAAIARTGQTGDVDVTVYTGVTGPKSFGEGRSFIYSNFGTGSRVAILGSTPALMVPRDYTSGTDLGASTSTWLNSTIAGLGLTSGSYVYRMGSASTADTFTVNVEAQSSAVPEPATWGLMLAGLGMVGAGMRSRRTRFTVAAA